MKDVFDNKENNFAYKYSKKPYNDYNKNGKPGYDSFKKNKFKQHHKQEDNDNLVFTTKPRKPTFTNKRAPNTTKPHQQTSGDINEFSHFSNRPTNYKRNYNDPKKEEIKNSDYVDYHKKPFYKEKNKDFSIPITNITEKPVKEENYENENIEKPVFYGKINIDRINPLPDPKEHKENKNSYYEEERIKELSKKDDPKHLNKEGISPFIVKNKRVEINWVNQDVSFSYF